MNHLACTFLILLLPAAGFVVLALFGKKYFKHQAGAFATGLLLTAFFLSLDVAYNYFFVAGKIDGAYTSIIALKYTWLSFSDNMSIDMGIILEPISVMMLVVVTFVSLMVHLFSLWYMKEEKRSNVYYSFLCLFTFSMLGLVISSNIFQLYMFWELVGLSSYLLIGFYYEKPSAVAAAKKAFIVTRFADLAFLIGILIIGFHAGSLDFETIIHRLTSTSSPEFMSITTGTFVGISAMTWGLTLVFIGGAGKSAMFPLHIWLPDAMEGPTPVSALIHAATMVVAGVYLVAKLFPLFYLNHVSLQIVMYVGAASALFAAIVACTQTDIKRVLAFSTMSQIGYMMFALGVSGIDGEHRLGYTASMFHLFTHAFFKSLLFLGAGAVIHFIHSNEIKDMGGLRKLLPVTHIAFLIACLAIAGIPPFAGFFSKEEILLAAYNSNKLIYAIALFTSGLTAFYMFRLYFSIFWSKQLPRQLQIANQPMHIKEGTVAMKIPLIILAICTTLAGFIPFGSFISNNGHSLPTGFHLIFSVAPVLAALFGIALATSLYKTENNKPQIIATSLAGLHRAAYRKFYIDEIYLFLTKKVIFNFIARPAAWIDKTLVDGLINSIGIFTARISHFIKGVQSGKVQHYALYFFGGVLTLAVVLIYIWK